MALLRGLSQIRETGHGSLVVAHFDHRLREGSQEDRQFVLDAAEQLGLRSEIGVASHPTRSTGDGVESAARTARYAFFREAAQRAGARFVVTAHTADDQAETILHRLLRGTGLRGAGGIARARPLIEGVSLLRPMLDIERECVLDYLSHVRQPYRTDHSNLDPQFLRNRIRNELLPLLETFQPAVQESLRRFASLARESNEVLEQLAESQLETVVHFEPAAAIVDGQTLRSVHPHLARMILQAAWRRLAWPEQDMSLEKWESLRQAVISEVASKQVFPGSVTVASDGRVSRLSR